MPETPTPAASPAHARRWILLALVVSTVLKILWAANSSGSVDCILFFNFARSIEKHGLCEVYRMDSMFNHTPLTGGLLYSLHRLASMAEPEIPDADEAAPPRRANAEFPAFSFLLRFVTILADVVMILAITANRERLGNPPTWALILLALSPVSLMVSGLHGNVDPLMTAFLVLATIAAVRGSAPWSGVALGLSCMVKVAVLPMVAVFFFYWLARKRAWTFVMACGAVGIAGTAWPLLECPREFLRNVFGYGSYWGTWGIPYWLRATGWESFQNVGFRNLGASAEMIVQALKVVIVAGILVIGWRRRHEKGAGLVATIAASWVWFFIFAPGIGMQYFVWIGPFLMMACPRCFGAFTVTATCVQFEFYRITSQGQWRVVIPQDAHLAHWAAVGVGCWLTLVVILALKAREWWKVEPARQADSGVPA